MNNTKKRIRKAIRESFCNSRGYSIDGFAALMSEYDIPAFQQRSLRKALVQSYQEGAGPLDAAYDAEKLHGLNNIPSDFFYEAIDLLRSEISAPLHELRNFVRNILLESLPKNEWLLLKPGDPRREEIKDSLYNMVQSTYESIGGHFKIQDSSDLDRYSFWVVKDLDDDPDADVALFGKPDIGGQKMGAAANDGSPAASAAYKNKSSELRAGGSIDGVGNWWGEVSDKPAYAMIRRGAPAVEDEQKVAQLLSGDDYEWHGEYPYDEPALFKTVKGWYTKKFGDHKSTKIILGSPS